MFSRTLALGVGCTLAAGLLWSPVAGISPCAAADRKTLLLLPVASGTPGQEWSAKALGGILEDGFSSLSSVRLVAGTARETALRELSASDTVAPEAFREICRRAGADLAILGGSTLVGERLALETRLFDVESARELPSFRGEEPLARAFPLVEAAIRHVAAQAALGGAESLFPGGVTVSLEGYAGYRSALLEAAPTARVEKLRAVLKLDANYADPTRRLGVELFRQGALDEALVVLERAVALGPKVGEARNNFGVALAAAGRQELAQREFEEAVSLAPGYAEARLNLARVLEDRGRTADAEQQYTVVLEADAGNDKARAGRAALYDLTGRPELAVKEFRQLSARRPDLAEAEFIRSGQEARKAREYARAEKYFRRAADINPLFAPAWAELGTNSYLAGEFPKGVEYFRKALTIDPGQAAYHYYLGLALEKNRQQDEALREYRRAVELGGPPEARLGLARAALESGDPGLAVEELNRLLVASPDHAEAKSLLAQATGEMEARRRLVEGQSQFANQRLARLEQIVADANRANRELEARLQSVTQEKRLLEKQGPAAAAAAAPPAGVAPTNEAAELKGQLLAAEGALAKAEAAEKAERERGERALVLERGSRSEETARLKAEVAAARADRADRASEVDKLKLEVAAARAAGQDRDRLAQELAAERARALAEQATRERADQALAGLRASSERAIAGERERGEQALAAEREKANRQDAQVATRVGALETQLKTQAEQLQRRETELISARERESALGAQIAKGQAALELLAERQAALEARAVADSRALAERERVLERARLAARDLALELGRGALRAEAWEQARGYLEQAAEADPRSGEAWYGLGEAFFQLGQFEKSKQMYDKAKQIY